MREYIKRDDVKSALNGACVLYHTETIDRIPSADVVEVVRCRDCEYWKCNPNTDRYGSCKKVSYDDFEVVMEDDDFCSYGERKDETD